MIREWCPACGHRLVEDTCLYFNEKGVRYIPAYRLRCPDEHDHRGVVYGVRQLAEVFWSAIAHERAKLTSTNGWCDACGEYACGCSTDPSEKGNG